jgi:hypothetical protein
MTWLAVLLKPLIWPVMAFVPLLLARFGAVAVVKWLPDGRLKRLLLRKV